MIGVNSTTISKDLGRIADRVVESVPRINRGMPAIQQTPEETVVSRRLRPALDASLFDKSGKENAIPAGTQVRCLNFVVNETDDRVGPIMYFGSLAAFKRFDHPSASITADGACVTSHKVNTRLRAAKPELRVNTYACCL